MFVVYSHKTQHRVLLGARDSVVGRCTYVTSRKDEGSNPDVIGFFNLPNPSSRTMALGSTRPLTEMNTRNLPGGKGRPAHKADKPYRHL
jgi:hypothetical protein